MVQTQVNISSAVRKAGGVAPAGTPPSCKPRAQAGRAAARSARGSQAHKRAPGTTSARPARTTRSPQPILSPRRARPPSPAPSQHSRPGAGTPARHDFRVVIGHRDHLHLARQADPSDRVSHRHQGAQPLQPHITVATTSRHATTVTYQRPPAAWDTKPEAHQGDVPTSPTDTQNVFLCRIGHAPGQAESSQRRRPVRSQHRRAPRPTATSRPVTPHRADGRHRLRRYPASR